MALPKSVIKLNKKGVQLVSNVDAVKYTIRELTFGAMYDTAKTLIKKMRDEAKNSPSLSHLPKNRFNAMFQYWVRKREADLQVGIKANTWYGVDAEFGTKNQPKRGILRDTTFNNVPLIREIHGKYFSAISDQNKAEALMRETEGKNEEVSEE
jgi:hypothetical protein